MKYSAVRFAAVFLLIGALDGFSQGFVNLNFDITTITTVHFPGGDRYTATVPRWAVNTGNFVNGDPKSIGFNEFALDAPAVTLQGTNSPFFPAIQGNYSILLQGGTVSGGFMTGNTNGASISQTGQIPFYSRSLTYLGSSLEVTFNGNPLSFVTISNTPNYTVWGMDISAYAGQMGELRFTSPWQSLGILDDIRFTSVIIPEPSALSLFSNCISSLCFRARQRIAAR